MQNGSTCGLINCPENIRNLVEEFTTFLKSVLGDNLIGVYLHGSLAMDCFNPTSSDVDLLIIVGDKLTVKQKKRIISHLLSSDLVAKRTEMSIVLEKDLKILAYPTPFELHYSHDWYDRYKNRQVDFNTQNYDEDLPAHFVVTRQRGICLLGKPVREIFPEIPRQIYVQSLMADARGIFENPLKNPVYTVLNLCRLLAFLTEGAVFSKKEGGEWALLALPEEFHPLIKRVLALYTGKNTLSAMNLTRLSSFIKYSKNRAFSLT